jgi:hypothetical protein
VSVGWLSCTWVGRFDDLSAFLAWAAPFVGELLPVERRWRGYDTVFAGEHGVLLGSRVRLEELGALELHLDIPATVLEGLELPRLLELMREVALYAKNVTRCDVTLDDWQKVITPAALDILTTGDDPWKLHKAQCVTKAEHSDFHRSKGPKGGDTWYLGGKTGLARLRVYDKARESGGEVDAIRWELQLRGDRAKDAVVSLALMGLDSPLDVRMGEWAASQLVRFVDFREREQDSNVTRCDRLPWFIALVLNAEKARAVVVPPPLTCERLHDYADKALPSMLLTLARSARHIRGSLSPEAYIMAMLAKGQERLSARHSLALRSLESSVSRETTRLAKQGGV